MAQFKSVIEVLKLLDKSNCRGCGEKTCMAFASAVMTGTKQLGECPVIPDVVVTQYAGDLTKKLTSEDELEPAILSMKQELQKIDLPKRAESIGATATSGRISLKIMGKDFSVDRNGNISTDIHVNSWIVISSFNYIINSKGIPVKGEWLPFRELPSGRDWYRLFGQQCEKPLKKIADLQPDLFEDLVNIFSGRQVSKEHQSDIAVILSPLPLVPMLFCYWKPEDGMGSSMNLFFDATAEDNLGIQGVYMLGTGIVRMFEKLAQLHGSRHPY